MALHHRAIRRGTVDEQRDRVVFVQRFAAERLHQRYQAFWSLPDRARLRPPSRRPHCSATARARPCAPSTVTSPACCGDCTSGVQLAPMSAIRSQPRESRSRIKARSSTSTRRARSHYRRRRRRAARRVCRSRRRPDARVPRRRSLRNPVNTSTASPIGAPPENGTKITL